MSHLTDARAIRDELLADYQHNANDLNRLLSEMAQGVVDKLEDGMTGRGGLEDPLKRQEREAEAERERNRRDINQGHTADWMRPGQTLIDPGQEDVNWEGEP